MAPPLFLIEGTFQNQLGVATAGFWLFILTIPVQSVIYAWIYTGTGGSVFSVVPFHAVQDIAGEVFSLEGAEGVELLIWAGLAAAVTIASGRRMLSPRQSSLQRGDAAAVRTRGRRRVLFLSCSRSGRLSERAQAAADGPLDRGPWGPVRCWDRRGILKEK